MKKALISLLIVSMSLIAILIGIFFGVVTECEARAESGSDELGEQIDENLNNLDFNAYEDFLRALESEYGYDFADSVKALIKAVIDGESGVDFDFFIKLISNVFLGELKKTIAIMITVMIIGVLYGLLKNMTGEFNRQATSKLVYIACYATVITLIGYLITSSISSTYKVLNGLKKFTEISFPLMLTLITALKGTVTATVYQPIIYIFGTVIFQIINTVVFPLFYVSLVFGIVNNFSEQIKLEKLSKASKSAANWILGISFGVFIAYITGKGISGASIDGLSVKCAKYALSSYVPTVGTYLKDGFDIVLASCVVIKNALGFTSVVILIFLILSPVIKILCIVLSLRITSGIVEPIADKKISELLYSVSDSLVLLIEIILSSAFCLFIFIMLIIYSCNWGLM